MNIASHKPQIHYRGQPLEGFDAVIPRIGASVTFYGCAVLRQFEMMGVFPLNESVAIARSRDKLRSLQLLSRKGIGLPITGFAHSPDDVPDLIEGGKEVVSALDKRIADVTAVINVRGAKLAESIGSKIDCTLEGGGLLLGEQVVALDSQSHLCDLVSGRLHIPDL